MNYAALRYVAETCTVQGAGRALLWAIAYRADNKTGECSARLSRLAHEAGMSYATAKRAKAQLLGRGEIEIILPAAGRRATCVRIIHADSSRAQIEPVGNPVEGSNENRRGLIGDPVEGSNRASPYKGEKVKNLEGFEGRASAAPPDGGASRFEEPASAFGRDWRAALNGSQPVKNNPAHPGHRPGQHHVGDGMTADDGTMRNGMTGPPRRKRNRPPRTRRGREPPAGCPVRSRDPARACCHPKNPQGALMPRLPPTSSASWTWQPHPTPKEPTMPNPTSNTRDCFTEFTGQHLVGVLFGRERPGRDVTILADMVFEDGRALTIASNGSHWVTSADEIQRAAEQIARRLERTHADLTEVLRLAGVAVPAGPAHPKDPKVEERP